MTAAPRRRWFKFGLRTMFVAMALTGAWLGWQQKIVSDRTALRGEIESRHGVFQFDRAALQSPYCMDIKPPLEEIPSIWRMMGATRVTLIVLPMNRWSQNEGKQAIKRLFPEASIGENVCLPGSEPFQPLPGRDRNGVRNQLRDLVPDTVLLQRAMLPPIIEPCRCSRCTSHKKHELKRSALVDCKKLKTTG